jgi:SagB-type dehydrogenase family enzyme
MAGRRPFPGVLSVAKPIHPAEVRTIALPPPQLNNTVTLAEALQRRHTSREFSPRPLAPDVLSALLWNASGVNRPETGHRTAPTARNWQEIDIYVALPEGAYRYAATEHTLQLVVAADLRAVTGMQDYVGIAPLNLVYVADLDKMVDATPEKRALYSATDTGFVAQNVYLYCAAAGLACVVRGWIDRDKLGPALGLRPSQRITLAQTVGYPQ